MVDSTSKNKQTIFNDPIYGFISVPNEITFRLIEHPYFQRLRRISQLALTHLVYPGAHHTRFQHAMGAMHLMGLAIEVLRSKGHEINQNEADAVTIAILLHDIGHGPYSHTLENSIVKGVSHEDLSSIFMDKLNDEFNGELTLAIEIFRNQYPKRFLHQLVSSQLDMDRLDYLKRDSFFTGVSEGVISTDRIIKLLNVSNDELVVDQKGIYSIESFIISRRLMYWQVYLHKTVLSAEYLLMKILKRAKEVALSDAKLFCAKSLRPFLFNQYSKTDFIENDEVFLHFAELDDFDILGAIKAWAAHSDNILSILCHKMVHRNLYKTEMQAVPFDKDNVQKLKEKAIERYDIEPSQADYFILEDTITNSAYNPQHDRINILYNDGSVQDVAEAADLLNISVLSKVVTKHFLCYPKDL